MAAKTASEPVDPSMGPRGFPKPGPEPWLLGPWVEGLKRGEVQPLGVGREAEVFPFGAGSALRLARLAAWSGFMEREAVALEAAGRMGAPVPRLYGRLWVDGRPGLILERLDGEDLLTQLGRKPWKLWSVARTLGRLHALLHEIAAPAELPQLRGDLRERLSSDLVPKLVRHLALKRLEALPDGECLCHGDFHPANLLPADPGYAVIDWTAGTRGDRLADVARTYLLLSGGDIPHHVPALVRRLDRLGRRAMLSGYLRAYAARLPLEMEALKRWLPVVAAARLAEGIEQERPRLLTLAGATAETAARIEASARSE